MWHFLTFKYSILHSKLLFSSTCSIHHAIYLKKGKISSFCCFSSLKYGYNLTEVSKWPNFIDTSIHLYTHRGAAIFKGDCVPTIRMPLLFFIVWQEVMAIHTGLQLLYVSARDMYL